MLSFKRIILLTLLIIVFDCHPLFASYEVKTLLGTVSDATTNERLPLATIRVIPEGAVAVADTNGGFNIKCSVNDSISITYLGYHPSKFLVSDILDTNTSILTIALFPSAIQLDEVIVKAGRTKYSKENNPAYDLMVKVKESKNFTNPKNNSFYSYGYYNKIIFGINNTGLRKKSGYRFLEDYIDTAVNTGVETILLSIKEKSGTKLFKNRGKIKKNIIVAQKTEGVDNSFDTDNIQKILDESLKDIDIYSDDIELIKTRFISPLSKHADNFYHYFITDTIENPDGSSLIELSFSPSNPATPSFNGRLYIQNKDSVALVDSVVMRLPRDANVNYLRNLVVKQKFKLDSLGYSHRMSDDLSFDLQIVGSIPGIYCRRLVVNDDFLYTIPDTLVKYLSRLEDEFVIDDGQTVSHSEWENIRKTPLTDAEAHMGSFLSRLRQKAWFYWSEKILTLLFSGYYEPNNNFPVAFGPINTFVSHNATEGWRVRIGGLTTTKLSYHWFGKAYVAYGFKDRKIKYMGELEYSFNEKKKGVMDFPINSLRLHYKYDVDFLGQHYLFTNPDNFFLSLKRKSFNLGSYQRLCQLEYKYEFGNNLSIIAGCQFQTQYSTPWVPFTNGFDRSFSHIYSSNLYLQVRYSPGEKFIQGKTARRNINLDAPIFIFTQKYGPSGILGSDFTVNSSELSVSKRFRFSAYGYMDAILSGGIVWSTVPYPFLMWPNVNLSYTIQPESYSLMNPMEFANDKYVSLDILYNANGVLFNMIPGFKKMKLREVVTLKALYGGLSKKNNPGFNPAVYRYPEIARAMVMDKDKPYMEVGIGIDNILTMLRIDYVWRLTYRRNPDIDKSGIRISLHFSF